MNRRQFIQRLAATGLLPLVPAPSLVAAAASPVAVTVPAETYRWAETIVRAHNKCNLGMLQRLLRLDTATADALKSQLLNNGIISAQANAYGMHTATKPLYEGAFLNTRTVAEQAKETVSKFADELLEDEGTEEKNEHDFSGIQETPESDRQEVESELEDARSLKDAISGSTSSEESQS